MRMIKGAQPIRPYEPPTSLVRTQGEPLTEQDCATLTTALGRGDAEIIEHGRWGPYNMILRWIHPETKPLYFLAEVAPAPAAHES